MKLEGEYIFNGSREEVWDLVRDPEVLAGALPGTQAMQKISDTEYEGSMNIRVGPVAGSFTGRLVVTDEVPPVSYALAVEGRGAPGFAKGTGAVQLMDQGDGTTLMKYEGDLQIGGKIAGVGQRLIDSVGKSIISQGLDSMNRALQARHAPAPPAEKATAAQAAPAETYRPPSETQFAAAVAKDVIQDLASDIFGPENKSAWVAATIAILGVIIGFWLGRSSARGR